MPTHDSTPVHVAAAAAPQAPAPLLPLAALLLAGSLAGPQAAVAQVEPRPQPEAEKTLKTVTVTASPDASTEAKDGLRVTRSRIGKGEQALRDIPQSVTVMTEKLISDRNYDDLKEVLKATAGVTFLAGETGEEDVRLRGYSLGQAGDIYVDGMRDVPIMERDTFNNDRIEVLKGSASMLFGKGSTGGVVNQVSKQAFLLDQNEVNVTMGTGNEVRVTGDFNHQTGEHSVLRVNVMRHEAANYGATVNKEGLALNYRWNVGMTDEFEASVYHLQTRNRPPYIQRWLIDGNRITPMLPAKNYYGLSTDHLNTDSDYLTLGHLHRFDADSELRTRLRVGHYERDLWGSVIGFGTTNGQTTTLSNFSSATRITRQAKGRLAESDIAQLQSDYARRFEAFGYKHQLLAGADVFDERAKRANSYAGVSETWTTSVGQPNVDSDTLSNPVRQSRGAPNFNTFSARSLGLYAQDTMALTQAVKLIGGLRFDRFLAAYRTSTTQLALDQSLWSPRVGALYQPDAATSYYASYGSSYNLSGDAYQFTPANPNSAEARTPAEKSRNIELGGKWEVAEKGASLGLAWFWSEKYNERNKDPDSAASEYLLSGKRHATGFEFNLAGRLGAKWEAFFNHTWIPEAKIDNMNGATATGNRPRTGDRPGLTPRHSGSLWATYQLLPRLRLGGGVNYRSEQTPELDRRYFAKGFATFDAMAEYGLSGDTLLKLNVSNLANRLYADALYNSAFLPGAPRSVQLSIKTLF